MAYANDAKHSMLADLVGKASPSHVIDALSLHTADPGTTGANESTAAQVAVTEADFDAPAAGEVQLNNDKTFTGGTASGACTHFGCWAGATFVGGGALSGDQTFNADGEYILQTGTKLDLNS